MLRREPGPSSSISDWELGLAAILFLLVVLATTLLVPAFPRSIPGLVASRPGSDRERGQPVDSSTVGLHIRG